MLVPNHTLQEIELNLKPWSDYRRLNSAKTQATRYGAGAFTSQFLGALKPSFPPA